MNKQFELKELIDFIENEHGQQIWTTVYEVSTSEQSRITYYSSFVKKTKSKFICKDHQWDVNISHGYPTVITTFNNGKTLSKYQRHSYTSFPPLIIVRHFNTKESVIEIAEEFRFFHNLYFDSNRQIYLSFDEAGDEIEVIRVTSDKVEIKTTYLSKFMIEAQINLALYFDCTVVSASETEFNEIQKCQHLIYSVCSGKIDERYSSLLIGKKLITCDSIELPRSTQKNYQEFYIGGDEINPILSTCNPNELDDLLLRQPNAPGHYLTPVFFKTGVLTNYYNNPSEYTVTESTVSRKGAWCLCIDNHLDNYVSVYLGDLGKLPFKTQTYWKSFNIIPDGHIISEIYFERTIQANFVESTRSDHVFKKVYSQLSKEWYKQFRWYLFLPLEDKDLHHIISLRYMLNNEQSEFDLLIGSLAKILNDSINIKKIESYLGKKIGNDKPIIFLEILLNHIELDCAAKFTTYLQKIQTLRSTGTAHRKGENYKKALEKYNIQHTNLTGCFNSILLEGGGLLKLLYEKIY